MVSKSTSGRDPGSARTYPWPRPAVAVDVALFTVEGTVSDLRLELLLVQRGEQPFQGAWALPGGFVREDEDLLSAARRELSEEAGIDSAFLEQVSAVGTPGRDPRGHTVTVLHAGLVRQAPWRPLASGDARQARYFPLAALPALAFDHAMLVEQALVHLRRRIARSPICFELLPEHFTLGELQALCEALLGRELDRRNFRRKVLQAGFLAMVKGKRREGAHRPAQLFRFLPREFEQYRQKTWSLPFY
jgi:8-oxo-dGTP diphosphatase